MTFEKIDNQEDLNKLLSELAKEPAHPYHNLPESVKSDALRKVQDNIAKKSLNDAYKTAFPSKSSSRSRKAQSVKAQLINYIKTLVGDDQSDCDCGCYTRTHVGYEVIRTQWKRIFTMLNPNGDDTDDEDRQRIDFGHLEDLLLNMYNGIWDQRNRHLTLENKLRVKRHELEKEPMENPPPQYQGGDAEVAE
ncbi:hypothetical protein HK097_006160 [Rhizophlyctis rosea]|uniref:Uncharacterized protein n=1 Tax=Rhizophlyctis rosea TaxID=64517 RepID=A0AAD5S1R5_9FUNG|nr:hypothetical protein HK097_006160 [Rhizophlyctis rosea]